MVPLNSMRQSGYNYFKSSLTHRYLLMANKSYSTNGKIVK